MQLRQRVFSVGAQNWILLTQGSLETGKALETLACFLTERDWAAVELRCLPMDTPRHFDPVSLEGDAVGGPAAAVRADALMQACGLDALLEPEEALLDLSLRLAALGKKMGYCPFAAVYVQQSEPNADAYARQLASKVLLAKKYGGWPRALLKCKKYWGELRTPTHHFAGVRKALLRRSPSMLLGMMREKSCAAATWQNAETVRNFRGQCALVPFTQTPLVSVVVRTCGRPAVLCHTLACLRNQTYSNFEVVVVEDGPDCSGARIAQQAADLPIRYHATGVHVGRGRAGNIGLEMAKGEFVCFLDDDDFFYPEYLELNLSRFYDGPEKDLVISSITAAEVDVTSRDPFVYTVCRRYPVIFDHLDLMDMCVKCRIPMTGAMFRRDLYEVHGGMREDIDGDEDWAMWLRFWRTARRDSDMRPDIPRAVSIFGYPADAQQAAKRLAGYAVYDDVMLSDETLCFTQDVAKVRCWCRRLKGDVAHLAHLGRAQELLDTVQPEKAVMPQLPQEGSVTLTAAQINGIYHALLQSGRQALLRGRLEEWLQQE